MSDRLKHETALDGWSDVFTSVEHENSADIVRYAGSAGGRLAVRHLIELYGEGLSNVICTEIPSDGLKNGISISGDEDGVLHKALESLRVSTEFHNAWSIARGLGGSIIVMSLDDGGALDEPVNIDRISAITDLEVFDRSQIKIDTTCFDTDTESIYFGKVYRYRVTLRDGQETYIHADRCLYFAGDFLPWEKKKDNDYFDGSVIQRCYSSLTKYGPGLEYINKILKRVSILKFGITGLAEKVAMGKSDEIKQRLRIMKQSMSTLDAAVYDADGETVTSETLNTAGLSDLIKTFMIPVSTESRIPVSRLFSKLVGGLGNEGDSDESRYYDHVGLERRRVLTPVYNRLIEYLCIANGIDPESVSWEFNPLKQTSKKEESEIKEKHYENIVKLYDMRLINTEDAVKAINDSGYSILSSIDTNEEL